MTEQPKSAVGIAEWKSGAALFAWGLWDAGFPLYHTSFQTCMRALAPRMAWIVVLLVFGGLQWYHAINGSNRHRAQLALCAMALWTFLFVVSVLNTYQSPGTPILFIWAAGQASAYRRMKLAG